MPQLELNGVPSGRGRGAERLEIVRAVQLLYELDERELAIPIFADMGENGDPDALVGLGELTSRHSDARGMLLLGKAALNRGRSKLAASPSPVKLPRTANPELTQVLQLYVERFNRRDWNGLRELIAADARLRVADAFAGKLVDSPYFGNYE